jgi:hypothetical protein
MNYEDAARKAIERGAYDEALAWAVLSLKQMDRTQQIADAACRYIRHPEDTENFARLATLVEG